jgi:hypothetical protein
MVLFDPLFVPDQVLGCSSNQHLGLFSFKRQSPIRLTAGVNGHGVLYFWETQYAYNVRPPR